MSDREYCCSILLNTGWIDQRCDITRHQIPPNRDIQCAPEHTPRVVNGCRCQALLRERVKHVLHMVRLELRQRDVANVWGDMQPRREILALHRAETQGAGQDTLNPLCPEPPKWDRSMLLSDWSHVVLRSKDCGVCRKNAMGRTLQPCRNGDVDAS